MKKFVAIVISIAMLMSMSVAVMADFVSSPPAGGDKPVFPGFIVTPFSDIHKSPDLLQLLFQQVLSVVPLKNIPVQVAFHNASLCITSCFKIITLYYFIVILRVIFKIYTLSLPHNLRTFKYIHKHFKSNTSPLIRKFNALICSYLS